MNDPYDNHPLHPANYIEIVARYGYIDPEQFSEAELEKLGYAPGRGSKIVDACLDIEEAQKFAQDAAKEFGRAVTVRVDDEAEQPIAERTFEPCRDESLEQLMGADIDVHEINF